MSQNNTQSGGNKSQSQRGQQGSGKEGGEDETRSENATKGSGSDNQRGRSSNPSGKQSSK